MRILFAVHPSRIDTEQICRFLEKQFRQDPKTFFLAFVAFPGQKQELEIFSRKFKDRQENFKAIEINEIPKHRWPYIYYREYNKSFLQALYSIKEKLGKTEAVEVISFGGSATTCYKAISKPAYEAIMKVFGRERVKSARTYLPLVYGKPCVDIKPLAISRAIKFLKKLKPKRLR